MSRPDASGSDLSRLAASLQAHLWSARRAGIRVLFSSREPVQKSAADDLAETLESVRTDLGDCTRCCLCRSRTTVVFGRGSPRARVVFVGAAPLPADDAAGEPFCGPEGQMLTNIITRVLGLTRQDVYLAYLVKCAPPEGRPPLQEEIATCLPFLHRQLAAIRPTVVCALGQDSARALLGTDKSLDELRGRFHSTGGMLVMPTHDLTFLLSNAHKKRETWSDMLMIAGELGRPAEAF